MEQALDYHDHLFINFQDYPFAKPSGHCYRWFDLKRFRLPSEPPEDVRLLDALLRHECRLFSGGRTDAKGTFVQIQQVSD